MTHAKLLSDGVGAWANTVSPFVWILERQQ